MHTAKKLLDRFLSSICVVLFAALVLLVVWQVFTRFVLNAPSAYSEGLATYCFVWLVLFGGALVFGENGHMAMDFIKNKLPKRLKISAEIAIQITIAAFSVLVLVIGGSKSAALTWDQATGSIPVTLGVLYLALPICGAFIAFYSIHSLVQIIRFKQPLENIPGAIRQEMVE